MSLRVRQLRPGLWRWTTEQPVGSVYAETADAVVLVDPFAPADERDAERFWAALDRDVERLGRPVRVLLTSSRHEHGAAAIAARYGAPVWRPCDPAGLPAGVVAEVLAEEEAVFVLLDHAALVAGDAIEGDRAGGLRVAPEVRSPLRRLLRHRIELVLVSHGDPVLAGGREALERALG